MYDAIGNQKQMLQRPSAAVTYDMENRVVSVTGMDLPSGTQYLTKFYYDGDGHRVMKLVCRSVTGPNACTPATVAASLVSSTTYVYDAVGQMAAEYGTAGTSGVSFLYGDHLGSTRLVTDAAGGSQQCYDYAPFGEEIPAGYDGRGNCYGSGGYPRAADTASMKFTGKERDAETGLDYFGARYFSSAQGRFTSPDEFPGGIVDPFTSQQVGQPGPLPYADITDPQTLNKYAYVRNNPLRYTDPDGHCGPWCAAIGAAGGATAQVLADWATGKPITLRKTFAAAVGGAIIGGTAGAASELGLAVQIAIVGDAGVVAGITERSITSGSINEAMGSPGEMAGDFVSNAAGHGLVRAVEGAVTRVSGGAVENLTDQLQRARTPNRQAKIQDRLDAATERLENKKTAASTLVDTTRETRSRIQQQKQGCRQGDPGCGDNK